VERTGLVYLGLLACLGLLAGSCGSADTGAPSEPDDADTTPNELAFDETTVATHGDIGPGGELRISLARPATFLPTELSLTDQESVIVADLLYDGLTEADARRSTLRPALATSWSSNDDATEWTFELDNDRVDADVVVAHFESLRTNATGSTAASLASLVAVENTGATTVRFEMDRPNAGLPWLLAGVAMSVVGERGEPTGRYDIEESTADSLVLNGRAAGLPNVSIGWEDTASDAYDRLTVGVVDAAVAPADALDDAAARYGVSPPARAVTRFYTINATSERLTDHRLRQAILLAVDRRTIVAEVIDVPAFALDGLLAPTLVGFAHSGCGRSCSFDPQRAARLVNVAAPGDDLELRIAVTPDQEPVANAIADDLAAVGFAPSVIVLAPGELATVVASGEVELFGAGWVAPGPSLDAVVPPLLASDSPVGPEGSLSGEVAELLDQAALTIDDEARWSLHVEAHAQAMRDGAAVPIAVAKNYWVAAPQAQSIPLRADGTIDLVGLE